MRLPSPGCSAILNEAALITAPSVAYLTHEESMQPSPRTYDFIGYDVGDRRRVQVTNTDGSYDARDGTRVTYGTECWMLGPRNKIRRTNVRVSNTWKLRYHEMDDGTSTWHLTMTTGVVVAFERLKRIKSKDLI